MLDLLVVIDPDATIRFANNTALDILGYTLKDIEGISAGRLFDDKELQFFGLVKRLISEGWVRNKGLYMLSKDGSRIPVVLNGSVIRNDDNKIEGMVLVARDMRDIHNLITELAQANEDLETRVSERTEELRIAMEMSKDAYRDLQETQSKLVQSEKMASIGQLAAGIAHEINNPTGFVLSNLKTLEDYIKDIKSVLNDYKAILKNCNTVSDNNLVSSIRAVEEKEDNIDMSFLLSDIDEIISETQEGMRRISKIVKDLKEFSHIGSDKPEYADINRGIESTLNIVWNELKYKAEVITVYGDIPQVLCYPQQLNQVFMNLFVNAAQAIYEKGAIKIKTFFEDNHAIVEISDTGKGIVPEHISRIFEPFFTTKPVGKGTGLGLAVAYAIIKKHGGEIKVESEIGKGSVFSVYLPVEYENFKRELSGKADE
jgi:PAS domain S-box-containing protein